MPSSQTATETKKVSLDVELRNAAAKLRKHVKHATDGPWVTSSVWSPDAVSTSAVYSHAHPTGTVEADVVAARTVQDGTDDYAADFGTGYLLDIARLINGEEAAS